MVSKQLLKLTQSQINEVTTELKTILDNEFASNVHASTTMECICQVPGIISERTWLFLYKGVLVLLHDLGNDFYSYVGCLQDKMDYILKDFAVGEPDTFQSNWALSDLDCKDNVSWTKAKDRVEELNMENDLKDILRNEIDEVDPLNTKEHINTQIEEVKTILEKNPKLKDEPEFHFVGYVPGLGASPNPIIGARFLYMYKSIFIFLSNTEKSNYEYLSCLNHITEWNIHEDTIIPTDEGRVNKYNGMISKLKELMDSPVDEKIELHLTTIGPILSEDGTCDNWLFRYEDVFVVITSTDEYHAKYLGCINYMETERSDRRMNEKAS